MNRELNAASFERFLFHRTFRPAHTPPPGLPLRLPPLTQIQPQAPIPPPLSIPSPLPAPPALPSIQRPLSVPSILLSDYPDPPPFKPPFKPHFKPPRAPDTHPPPTSEDRLWKGLQRRPPSAPPHNPPPPVIAPAPNAIAPINSTRRRSPSPAQPSLRSRKAGITKPISSFECEYCKMTFGRKHHKERHVDNLHRQNTGPTCPTCGISFHQKPNLFRHMQLVHNEMPYRCTLCGTGFSRRIALRRHHQFKHASSPEN